MKDRNPLMTKTTNYDDHSRYKIKIKKEKTLGAPKKIFSQKNSSARRMPEITTTPRQTRKQQEKKSLHTKDKNSGFYRKDLFYMEDHELMPTKSIKPRC